jgi:hypothetical protein
MLPPLGMELQQFINNLLVESDGESSFLFGRGFSVCHRGIFKDKIALTGITVIIEVVASENRRIGHLGNDFVEEDRFSDTAPKPTLLIIFKD